MSLKLLTPCLSLLAALSWCVTLDTLAEGENHPFLLWTEEEAAAIRQRLETDELAKKQYERMQLMESRKVGNTVRGSTPNPAMLNLFKYAVLGDEEAGEREKRALLGCIGKLPPQNRPGNPATSNAAWRDDRTLDALRYDVLYGELTDEQRQGIEKTIRNYVAWFLENPGPCSRPGRTRVGWLPNMQWPTAAGVHILAVVSRDEELIRSVFGAVGGWKWFFDNYVGDGRFYMEEFGKYYSNIGSMLLWCEGLERLGLPQYGYGYTSPDGANMFNFLEMLMWAGYPRVMRGTNMPDYPTVYMGDAGPLYVVNGRDADGTGGNVWWRKSNMNGPIPKMYQPFWWEIGHRRFPDAGFDYFLAQMRAPGEEVYLPSLYFGAGPVDPELVSPPPSVRSYVAPTRGFAMLRAEESPAYWESPKPALSLQFAMYYMHYVHDCFCILQYVAGNRFVYQKQGYIRGGYAGNDPCRDSTRGQASGVTVDSLQIQPVDSGEEGCRNQRIRHRFSPTAKFVAVRARPRVVESRDSEGNLRRRERALYPGIAAERALVLTDEYLFDVFRLVGDSTASAVTNTRTVVNPANHVFETTDPTAGPDGSHGERVFDWHVQGPGHVRGADAAPWSDSADLADGEFWDPRLGTDHGGKQAPDPDNVRMKAVGDAAWAETILQGGEGESAVGVRVAMLASPGTSLYAFTPPAMQAGSAAVLMARRAAPAATFVALHEPFTGGIGGHKIVRFERLSQNERGLAVAIVGRRRSGINDRILLSYGDDCHKPRTLSADEESFTFTGCVHIRIGRRRVDADGPLIAMQLRVSGSPTLVINGEDTGVKARRGVLALGALNWKSRASKHPHGKPALGKSGLL